MAFSVFLLASPALLTTNEIVGSPADALILDLDAGSDRDEMRQQARTLLLSLRNAPGAPVLHVRIGSFANGQAEDDLKAVMGGDPQAVHLPACENGAEVQRLDVLISVLEAETGRAFPPARIFAEHGATASGLLASSSYRKRSDRLAGLVWNGEALLRHTGLSPAPAGSAADIAHLGRAMTLLRAREAEIPAFLSIEAAGPANGATAVEQAKADGFTGIVTHDPHIAAVARKLSAG